VPHTATAGKVFDSGVIAPGKSWTTIAESAGRHDYLCSLHPTMKASLLVQ
jgi:plastocyanin